MSEDFFLEVCVPDPEFSGKSYAPPMPCPVGSTYRRTRGYVSQWSPCAGHEGSTLGLRTERATWVPFILQVLGSKLASLRELGQCLALGCKLYYSRKNPMQICEIRCSSHYGLSHRIWQGYIFIGVR